MYQISKNFATAILDCNFQQANLDLLNFETSSISILSLVGQNDSAKDKEYPEAEQLAQNECVFDIIEAHWKTFKSTIKGLGTITSMDCIVKDIQPGNPVLVLYSTCIKLETKITRNPINTQSP